jgi:hypothetical protein
MRGTRRMSGFFNSKAKSAGFAARASTWHLLGWELLALRR